MNSSADDLTEDEKVEKVRNFFKALEEPIKNMRAAVANQEKKVLFVISHLKYLVTPSVGVEVLNEEFDLSSSCHFSTPTSITPPAARIISDLNTIIQLSSGTLKPMSAVLSGRIKIQGERKAFAVIVPAMKHTVGTILSESISNRLQETKQRLRVTITGHTVESGNYTSYCIEVVDSYVDPKKDNALWIVKHRYSDFITLRRELKAWGIHGLPALTYSRYQSSIDRRVIEQRMKVLSAFLAAVMERATLGNKNCYNPCVISFLKLKKEVFHYQHNSSSIVNSRFSLFNNSSKYTDSIDKDILGSRDDYEQLIHDTEEAIEHVQEHAGIRITCDVRSVQKTSVIWREFEVFRDRMHGDGEVSLTKKLSEQQQQQQSTRSVIFLVTQFAFYCSMCLVVYWCVEHVLDIDSNSFTQLHEWVSGTTAKPLVRDPVLFHASSYLSIFALVTLLAYRESRIIALLLIVSCLMLRHMQYMWRDSPQDGTLSGRGSLFRLILKLFAHFSKDFLPNASYLFFTLLSNCFRLICYNVGFFVVSVYLLPRITNILLIKYARAVHIVAVGIMLMVVYGTLQLSSHLLAVSATAKTKLYDSVDAFMAPYVVHEIAEFRSIFVKFAQYVGGRSDMMSPVWVRSLSVLHDQCPPSDPAYIRRTVERAFGRPIEEVYHYFNMAPVASASIAQVHEASVLDPYSGNPTAVVVKIQHEDIARVMRQDMKIVVLFIKMATKLSPMWSVLLSAVQNWQKTLNEELDFNQEARSMREVGNNLKASQIDAVVPETIPLLTRHNILTMTKLEGYKINDKLALSLLEIDKFALLSRITHCIARQFLVDGLLNADPHPGNLMFCPSQELVHEIHTASPLGLFSSNSPGPSVPSAPATPTPTGPAELRGNISPGLLDFGMTIRIEEARRILFCRLFLAMFEYDEVPFTQGTPHKAKNSGGQGASGRTSKRIASILAKLDYCNTQSKSNPQRDVEFFDHIFRDATPGSKAQAEHLAFQLRRRYQREEDVKVSDGKQTPDRVVTSLPHDIMCLGRVMGLLRGLTAELDCSCPILHIFALHARVGLLKYQQANWNFSDPHGNKFEEESEHDSETYDGLRDTVAMSRDTAGFRDTMAAVSPDLEEDVIGARSMQSSPAPTAVAAVTSVSIDEQFDRAVVNSKKLPSDLSSATKLQIYAHYKCATVGPISSSTSAPGMFDVVAKAKYDAYKAHCASSDTSDLKKNKGDYVAYIKKLLKDNNIAAESDETAAVVSAAPTAVAAVTSDSIDEQFDRAVVNSKKLPSDLSSATKLQIYAHYKCATVGPISSSTSAPGMFDVVAKAKYDAYKAHCASSDTSDLKKNKGDYVAYIKKLLKDNNVNWDE